MKIAIPGVITKPIKESSRGGAEVFTYLLIEGLVKKGHDVTLYCAKGSKTSATRQIEICDPDEAMENESNVEFVYPYTLIELRKVLDDLAKEKFDLLHVNILKTFLFSFFVENIDIPVLYTIHRDFLSNPKIYNFYKEIGFSQNEHFCFVSEQAKKKSLLKSNTHFIYNGIDNSKYPFVKKDNQDHFLWFSRMDPLKGPGIAIEAAKLANIKLILSGDIDREKNLNYFKKEIKPNLSSKIIYEPFLNMERKIELYQGAKALIFPVQLEEQFGFVVAEAMSCGTPVIAFDRGAMPEIIKDGVNGFLVKKEDGVIGIVDAINKVQQMSEKEYKDMREECRKTIMEKFTIDRMIESYERLYAKLLNK